MPDETSQTTVRLNIPFPAAARTKSYPPLFIRADGFVVQDHDSVSIASRGQKVAEYLSVILTGECGGVFTKDLWVPIGLSPGLLFLTGLFHVVAPLRPTKIALRNT